MTLTREWIEKRIARLENSISRRRKLLNHDDPELINGAKKLIEHAEQELALCTMALAWLDMQPRPISEAPKDGTRLLVFLPDKDGVMIAECTAWPNGWTGKWPTEYMGYSGGPPTHFIPLSSFPEPK